MFTCQMIARSVERLCATLGFRIFHILNGDRFESGRDNANIIACCHRLGVGICVYVCGHSQIQMHINPFGTFQWTNKRRINSLLYLLFAICALCAVHIQLCQMQSKPNKSAAHTPSRAEVDGSCDQQKCEYSNWKRRLVVLIASHFICNRWRLDPNEIAGRNNSRVSCFGNWKHWNWSNIAIAWHLRHALLLTTSLWWLWVPFPESNIFTRMHPRDTMPTNGIGKVRCFQVSTKSESAKCRIFISIQRNARRTLKVCQNEEKKKHNLAIGVAHSICILLFCARSRINYTKRQKKIENESIQR